MSTAVRSASRARPQRARPRRAPGRPPTGDQAWLALGGAAALAAAAVVSPAGVEDGPVLCPVRQLTGLPCPGCGLVRAWVYALHGRWAESLAAHPFGLLSVSVVASFAVVVLGGRLLGRLPGDRWDRRYPTRFERWGMSRPVRWGVALTVVAWLGFAVVRAFATV